MSGPLREESRSAQRPLIPKARPQNAPRIDSGRSPADVVDDDEIVEESDLEDQDDSNASKSRPDASTTATESARKAHIATKGASNPPMVRTAASPRKIDLNDIWDFFGNDPFMSAWLANGFSQSRQKQTELSQLLSAVKGLVQEGRNRLRQEVIAGVSSESQKIADVVSRSLEGYERKLKGHSTFIDGMSNDLTKLLKDQSALQHDNWEKFQKSSRQFQAGLKEDLDSHEKTILEALDAVKVVSTTHKEQSEVCTKHQADLQDAQNKLLQATCELENMKTQLSATTEATGLSSRLDDQMSTLRADLTASLVEIKGRSETENEKIMHALQNLECKVNSAFTDKRQDVSIELTQAREALEKLQGQLNSVETKKQDAEARAKVLETEIADFKRQAAEVEVSKQVADLQESFTSEIAKLRDFLNQMPTRQVRPANATKAPREQSERETRSTRRSQDRDGQNDKQREQIAADLEKQSKEARRALEEQIKGLEARMLQDNAERQSQSLKEIRVLREDRAKDLETRNEEKQRALEEQSRFLAQQRKDKELYEKELKLKDDERQKALEEQHRLLDQQSAEREARLRENFDNEVKQRIAEVQKEAEAHMLEQINAVKSQLQRSENTAHQQVAPQPASDIRPPTASPLSASSKENKAPADADSSQDSFVARAHHAQSQSQSHIADTVAYDKSHLVAPARGRVRETVHQPQTRAHVQVVMHDYPRPPTTSSIAQAIPLVDPFGGDGRRIQPAKHGPDSVLPKPLSKPLKIRRSDKPSSLALIAPLLYASQPEPSYGHSTQHRPVSTSQSYNDESVQDKPAMFGMTWSPDDGTSRLKTKDLIRSAPLVDETALVAQNHAQRSEHSNTHRKRKHAIEDIQQSLPPSLRCKTPASLVSTRPGSTVHNPVAATYNAPFSERSHIADDVRAPGTTRSKPKMVESRYHSTRGSSVQPRLGGGVIRLSQSSAPKDKLSQGKRGKSDVRVHK